MQCSKAIKHLTAVVNTAIGEFSGLLAVLDVSLLAGIGVTHESSHFTRRCCFDRGGRSGVRLTEEREVVHFRAG